MVIMGCRYENLQKTFEALCETGTYLLAKINGVYSSIAAASADDIGIYYFIPFIMSYGHSLDAALLIFYYGLLAIAGALALYSFIMMGGLYIGIYSLVVFCFLFREGFFRLSDTYAVNIFCTFFVVPFSLYLCLYKKNATPFLLILWFFLAGLISGYCHYIRLYSSLPILFLVSMLPFLVYQKNKSFMLLLSLVMGLLLAVAHMQMIVVRSESFLKKHHVETDIPYTHSFWHNIYAGLGYVDNSIGLYYDDVCSAKKVEAIDPSVVYHSKEYEALLKKEVCSLMVKERMFVGSVLFAKLGVVLFFILTTANFGLLAAYYTPRNFLDYIFWIAMMLSSLSGIVVVPRVSYLSGLIALAFIYGIYSVIQAINSGCLPRRDIFYKTFTNLKRVFYANS